jgi:hypothetical protein
LSETASQSILHADTTPPSELKFGIKRNVLKAGIERIAIEKFRSSGFGITYPDVQREYPIMKKHAQRSLKYLHGRGVLFTASDLTNQGIHLLENKNPQQYFPSCIKAEIIENLKKRKTVHNNQEFRPLSTSFSFANSNVLQDKKAQTFLHVLLLIPYYPPYIHKLQLIFSINKPQISKDSRIESHEEIIGRRHVKYTISSSGTVQIAIRSNNSPFRLETELDESTLFSFFGQVKDRLLYLLTDVRELVVPPVTEWILIQCDVNKDIEIDEKGQLTLHDIQLKYADRVFREYVKIKQGKAYCRVEESVKLNKVLLEALDNIRHPFTSIERKIDSLTAKIDEMIAGRTEDSSAKQHGTDLGETVGKQSNDKEEFHNAH